MNPGPEAHGKLSIILQYVGWPLRIVLGEVLDSENDNIQKIFHSVIDPIESRVSVPAESDSWGLPAAGSDPVGSASSRI